MSIDNIVKKLQQKKDLNNEDLSNIVHYFQKNLINNEEIKKLVLAWREKKETTEELNSLSEILLQKERQIETIENVIDFCGTGGDKLNTFNISTLSSIVASSLQAKVIKHSGRSTTSTTGSVDILCQFGFDFDIEKNVSENCFKNYNLMFTSSKVLRETFGSVKKVCKEINLPGFVNLIGPLTNPYKASFHLLGVSKLEWGDLMATTLQLKGVKRALVVCSEVSQNVYMDELSFCGKNYIWEITNNEIKINELNLNDFGIDSTNINDLVVKDINESKLIFENILKGKISNLKEKAHTIALNTGAALYLTNKAKSIYKGFEIALQHIKSGKSWEHFYNFINCIRRET